MATTIKCDLCTTEVKGPTTIIIDGGVYTVQVTQFNIPAGVKKIDDICPRCLFKRVAAQPPVASAEQV